MSNHLSAILDQLSQQPSPTAALLRRLKRADAKGRGQGLVRNDELLRRYRDELAHGLRRPDAGLEQTLQLNAVRSSSGLATVTVITEPYPCPGRCVYCPTEARAPKSYLTNEPAVLRALRHDYDPYRQVAGRLSTLHDTGHPTDKIELIVKGGTWSFYPEAYQEEFIRQCFQAANEFAQGSGFRVQPGAPNPEPQASSTLEEIQRANEAAGSRIIGLTIETRPDYVTPDELRRLRRLGVTRVELGVQTLNDDILTLIVRDHGTAEIRQATALLRNAGFKIAYHLMPNLPGATPEDDLAVFRRLFEEPAYRPDAMKIYPCVVVATAELFHWWKDGRYQPYDDETLIELLIQLKQLAPPYLRLERIIRDIPSTSIEAGCRTTNLREEVQRRMRARGLRCRCLRCREVRHRTSGDVRLIRREYDASDGREIFLSFEEPESERLAAFLRLRISPADVTPLWPALRGAALIRELHTYGRHVPLHDHHQDAAQHRGFGRRLIEEAERIAREEFGAERMAVIAGVGVREYYRKLEYALADTYMVKRLAERSDAAANSSEKIKRQVPSSHRLMKRLETLTPNEVAKSLKLHPFTVTRLAREGKLPSAKVLWRMAERSAACACPPGVVAGRFLN